MNAVTARLEGKKKKAKQQTVMQDICFWCKEERQRGKEVRRIIQNRAAGRQWGRCGAGGEAAGRRAPVVGQQIAPHLGAQLHGK